MNMANYNAQFIDRLRRQEPEAFRVLLDDHDRRVYGIAYRMIPSREDVDDVAQEAFVEIWRSLPRFRGDSQLGTWIHRVATNVCLEHRRRKRGASDVSLDELPPIFEGSEESPQHAAERNALKERVGRCIHQFRIFTGRVVVLHELQGLTYKEVARQLRIPEGTVKSRLNASLGKLRDLLTPQLAELDSL